MPSQHTHKKVYVGLSGGVDSSVAAALLKEQRYDVTGVFIKIWHPAISNCDWKAEMRDAMRVCAHLDIPFKMIDLSDLYFDRVIGYMLDEYSAGRTPNPDVMCNEVIKFGAFYDWAIENDAEFVATGHYAQIMSISENGFVMKQGIDVSKDQTYFLWKIKKEQLAHILFPVGSYTKTRIRKMAADFELPTATKRDSQGLCFVGDVDVKSFLQQHLSLTPGDVLDEHGAIIGTHDGAALYTLGERHGYLIKKATTNSNPHFVIAKDIIKNTITVSDKKNATHADVSQLRLSNVNVLLPIDKETTYFAMCRYHAVLVPCRVDVHEGSKESLRIVCKDAVERIAVGQSVVLYTKSGVCIGGGVVSS